MARSGCPTKGRNLGWGGGGEGRVPLQAQMFELSPSVGYHPHQKIEFPRPS